jgi:hypothetical protein
MTSEGRIEILFKRLRIRLTNPKGDRCAYIRSDGFADLGVDLCRKLICQSKVEFVFSCRC